MTETDLPEPLREALQPIRSKHEARGWTKFMIDRTDDSPHPEMRISLHATSPAGTRVHRNFTESESLPREIDAFLSSN
jgi:hypothetical protein